MGKRKNSEQSLDDNASLLLTDGIQDSWHSNEGSNAIILPGKKNKKKKAKDEGSNQNKAPPLSKSMRKRLQQLQAEKERKLLQAESIKILEKYKIWDGAYSLLQSSATIGQAETTREKRRRAMQLSKAGLEVPEDVSPFRKKGKRDTLGDCEVSLDLDSVQSYPENVHSGDRGVVVKCTNMDSSNHGEPVGIHLATTSKRAQDVDDGTSAVSSSQQVINEDMDTCIPKDQKNAPSISFSSVEHNAKSQDRLVGGSNTSCPDVKSPADYPVQEHVITPFIVHVSRPKEVEEKRKDLPIIMMEQEIMEAIHEHSIVILCGETGCGKTTQVPQFLYEAGFGSINCKDRKGTIGVTQPRRVAVLATAKRVSFELGLRLGKEVGFQVRHDKRIGDSCSIKFMTDGILLRELQSDFLLKRYSVIVLDEAHERSLNTDILVGMLSRIIKIRQELYMKQREMMLSGEKISPENRLTQLKLVLMSATLRVEDFVSEKKLFHENPPVLEVPVRQFPVTIHFSKRTQEDYLGQAYKKVMSIHKRLPPGGILVFVTGQREVDSLCKKLRKASRQMIEIKSKRQEGNEISSGSDFDMKEISEAFEEDDRFPSYEEDDGNSDIDFDSSDSETESELEAHTEEAPEKTGLMLDFLRDPESLSSLKASFEALAGKPVNHTPEEELSLPVPPIKNGRAESAGPSPGPLYVLPLYAMLPASAQLRVFEEVPEGERLVVVATNVAETSLTIPGIKYVVDTGKEKVKNYNYANGVATFEVQWISKASAAQRAGRAGRTGPGHCYRLYSSGAFSKDDLFPGFSCPEISKVPVDGVVLLLKSMGIKKVAEFPFPTPPETTALKEAEKCLKALEALDVEDRLTPLGRAMAQYPMSPRHSRMLLTVIQLMKNHQGYARANILLGYAIAAASAMSFPNPSNIMQFSESHDTSDDFGQGGKSSKENSDVQLEKQRQKKAKAMAREARARFSNASSDALTIAYALQLFESAENSWEFCKNSSLHLKTMEEMSKLRKQLLRLIFHHGKFSEEFGWDHGSYDDVELSWKVSSSKHPLLMNEEEILGQAICAGWADRVAKRVRKVSGSLDTDRKVRAGRYQSNALDDAVYLHRFSSVSQTAPDFVVYTELLQTNRPYMHGVTSVKSDWLVKYARPLCNFSAPLTDPKPYYEPLSDQVLCWVSPIFGRHNWQLPLHSVPMKSMIKNDDDLRVFASALLEGRVLPCLRSAQKFLSAPPSTVMRPEALGQRRVGDLVNRLKIGSRKIDTRTILREVWTENPSFLYSEIKHWFQERFHDQFEELWEQMHSEVLLDGCELFPKRVKNKKKQTNRGNTK